LPGLLGSPPAARRPGRLAPRRAVSPTGAIVNPAETQARWRWPRQAAGETFVNTYGRGDALDLELWQWIAFGCLIVAGLLVDLIAFGHRGERISLRLALAWSVGWSGLGLAFTGVVWWWGGRARAEEYLAGFLVEKSLSLDNLFVFAVIFAYFAVPAPSQRRVLFWGIVGAIVLRGVFILAGAALLEASHLALYVFAAFLVATGIRMARHSGAHVNLERSKLMRFLTSRLPMTSSYSGDALFVREGDGWVATPMVAALVLVAAFDVVFAIDSIPAIFAITREVFIVYAANAFSLLGLAALYFLLADMVERFRYLNVGLGVVLAFVGLKMGLSDLLHVPTHVSLGVILAVLGGAIGLSMARASLDERAAVPKPTMGEESA